MSTKESDTRIDERWRGWKERWGERKKGRRGEERKRRREAFSLRRGDSYYFALGWGEGGNTDSRVDKTTAKKNAKGPSRTGQK